MERTSKKTIKHYLEKVQKLQRDSFGKVQMEINTSRYLRDMVAIVVIIHFNSPIASFQRFIEEWKSQSENEKSFSEIRDTVKSLCE